MECNPIVTRRGLLSLLGAGLTGARLQAFQHAAHTLKTQPEKYELQFFTAEQDRIIDRVADMVLPPDEHSSGAHAARVSSYIDLVVANSPADLQTRWQTGLSAFDETAHTLKGKPFMTLNEADQTAVLKHLAKGLKAPDKEAEQFFADMRKWTIAGYYSSRIGLVEELGYVGNQVLGSYPGCAS
jgi:hypothetical protein